MSSSVLGVALVISSPWDAGAVTLNTGDFPDTNFTVISDTPTLLDLKFTNSSSNRNTPLTAKDEPSSFYDPNNYPSTGPVYPVFSSDYWNVSVQTESYPNYNGPGGPLDNNTLFVEQVIPGQSDVSNVEFSMPSRKGSLGYSNNQRASYLADAPARTFVGFTELPAINRSSDYFIEERNNVTCTRDSANCVYYELINNEARNDYELRGFFQPNDSEPVPEPSSIVGSLTALLALFGFTRLRKSLSKT